MSNSTFRAIRHANAVFPAHRTLIVRKLKHLENLISFTAVHWHMGDRGWRFATADEHVPGDNVGPDPHHTDFTHLRQIASHYQQTSKKHHTLFQAVDSEFSFALKYGLHSILTIATYGPIEYQVDVAHKAMKGIGTNDTRLIRVVLRNRRVMPQLRQAYQARHSRSLRDAIHSETSGSYRNALLTIVDHNPSY